MPATDKNKGWSKEQLQAPLEGGFAITPSDATELTTLTRAISVLVAGNLALTLMDGSSVIVSAVPGVLLQVRAKFVKATGTTATGIVGLY